MIPVAVKGVTDTSSAERQRDERRPSAAHSDERHAAIERAKLEWEATADALTSMVCLLDPEGLIRRVNKVVEHWGLGSVGGVIGKAPHTVLHPACVNPQCRMLLGLQKSLTGLQDGEVEEFEFYSAAADQTLKLAMRPMRFGSDNRTVLVVTDVSALRRAQTSLQALNRDLEERVRSSTRELRESNRDLRREAGRREQAELELRASRNNLALLSEQLIQAQEGERRRIALELHDSVGQSLSAIKYTLERAIIMVQRGNLGSPESVLAQAVQRIHETADGIRAISMNLRPRVLDDLGAASAASWFCRGFSETYPALTVRSQITAKNSEIPPRISTHVYRCMQELLNNVAKHACARNVSVFLTHVDGELRLAVEDDGVGMPPLTGDTASFHGSGLRNLRERAEMTDGRFSISSAPNAGTSAEIIWRLPPS